MLVGLSVPRVLVGGVASACEHKGLLVQESFPHSGQHDLPGEEATEQGRGSQALALASLTAHCGPLQGFGAGSAAGGRMRQAVVSARRRGGP